MYKAFLVLFAITLIVLFAYPRISAHAQQPSFPEVPTTTPRQMILQFASSFQIDGRLAIAIVECESQLHPAALNPHSTAKGLFQFINSSWKRYSLLHWGEVRDVLSAADNAELGTWVIAQYGTGDWSSSKGCWE